MPKGMLVVTRRTDEEIVINGTIRVMVVEVSGKKVKLGTKAPPEVPVHRAEIWEQIEAENSPKVCVPAELDGVSAIIQKRDGQYQVDILSDNPVAINLNGVKQ